MSMMVQSGRFAPGGGGGGPLPDRDVFSYTGAYEEVTVASGYSLALVRLWAGAGGNGNYSTGAWSGAGGYVAALFPVSPGDTLRVEVPQGGQGAARNANGGAGGWPDGGPGAKGDAGSGGGGGSARFYRNSSLKAVAGAGGGSGGYLVSAGAGGGTTGQSAGSNGGTGGTPSAGGVDSSDTGNANKTGRSIVTYPAARTGGYGSANGDPTATTTDDGGGGGGGYWGGGGGGGDGQAGGGGSSWTDSDATLVLNTAGAIQTPATPCRSDAAISLGINSGANGAAIPGGNGRAEITFLRTADGAIGQSSGTTSYSSGSNTVSVIPTTVPVGGVTAVMLTIGIHTVTAGDKVRGVIYADSGGSPGALVAYTDETALFSYMNGTQVPLLFDQPVNLPAGNYWIGTHNSAGTLFQCLGSGPATTYKFPDTYGDGPASPFGTPTGTFGTYLRIEMPYYV